ncbi:MAG TPA: YggT family protein [Clostridiaceae bacterium]|nr:YggT family protein [Clostridiaceae bacterium]
MIITAFLIVLRVIEYAILARVIVSWLPIQRSNRIIMLLYQITEPILGPIRSMIERSSVGRTMLIDFSPIIAFLIISLVRNIVARIALGI